MSDRENTIADSPQPGGYLRHSMQGGFYSRFVRFMRIALPASAALMSLAVVMWLIIGNNRPISAAESGVVVPPDGQATMENVSFLVSTGTDHVFIIRARRARYTQDNQNSIHLDGITGNLTMADGGTTSISSRSGLYDVKKQTLLLGTDVVLAAANGVRLHGQDVWFHSESGEAGSDQAVRVFGSGLDFTAQGFHSAGNGGSLFFTGPVRVILVPD